MNQTDMNELAATEASSELDEMGDIVNDFLVESYENLDQLDRDLVTLEQDPTSRTTLASIFRTIHTIKGTCGFFGFTKLEAVTHAGESLLSRLREGQLQFNSERATGLLALVDAVRQMLSHIETAGQEGEGDYSALVEQLKLLQKEPAAEVSAAASAVSAAGAVAAPPPSPSVTVPVAAAPEPPVVVPSVTLSAAPVVASSFGAGAAAALALSPEPAPALPLALEAGLAAQAPEAAEAARGTRLSDNSIRVDVGLLDVLMNLVGELVLARNQILQYTGTQADSGFNATTQRLNMITSELQEGVMKTRMQPIGNIWSKFPRVVRDLALTCQKKIRLEMAGTDTEMDKTIIEAIKDPLTHLVRNACDHGIENPEARVRRGKPAEGCIALRAYHEGGQVNIEITDDGAGIDPEKVKQRALQRGLITPEHAARMGERETVNLIFLPGFSTAEKVTNISGRGVGMDVVKTHIEKIGGTVDIQSKPGQGSTIKIKIPLTLAIIPALIITSAGDRYAIPQVNLLELVRLESEQARSRIELIYDTPVYRLRGNLLPLVYLNRELRVEGKAQRAEDAAVNIVVLRADDRQFGLVVDEINDTEEIVVKPLGQQLKGITCFAGATIMGDGKVALILDVLGLAQHARVVSEVRDRARNENSVQEQDQAANRQTLLLFQLGTDGRMAMPLSQVARLEEFAPSALEKAMQQEVVQYRGQIMPVLRLSRIFGYDELPLAADEPLKMVVYSKGARSIGLIVDQILDIVEESVNNQYQTSQAGILGTAVIQQRVTDLLDVQGMLLAHAPESLAYNALDTENAMFRETISTDSTRSFPNGTVKLNGLPVPAQLMNGHAAEAHNGF
jgi:two-component system chemotaxis sensor kinase CheA